MTSPREALNILHRYSFGSDEIERSQIASLVEIVNDSLGDYEYGVDDVGMRPEGPVWADAGEKRPINLETTLEVAGRLRHWYGVDKIYRRRKAGEWELFDHGGYTL